MTSPQERLVELLVDQATTGLSEEAERELRTLATDCPEIDTKAFELAAAAVHLALLPTPHEPLPATLRQRLEQDAAAFFDRAAPVRLPPQAPAAPRATPAWLPWTGWLAAAAALLLWAIGPAGVRPPPRSEVPPLAQLERRASAGESGVSLTEWTATGDAIAPTVTGAVIWSSVDQVGYMVFEGLTPNDPQQRQYQLWIFDEQRPAETPIDGGLFDVTAEGRAVVPIDPKLPVTKATLFAVTAEAPGGVVVSKRDHILVTAAL